jgi:peptidoglycan/xylan/chitin deacetylase (PgdA/CDA1 family)
LKHLLNKIKFGLGLDPKIEKRADYNRFIPAGYKSVLLIYADFELAWAWRYSKGIENPVKYSEETGKAERKNLPEILDICETYDIPITWATVGHLFLDSCDKYCDKPHPAILRPDYFESKFWSYTSGDWFDADPCSDVEKNGSWYCPDLIKLILKQKTKHEIGCHTFSHIDCTNEYCSSEVFNSDIEACKIAADKLGVKMTSFVHPAHTIGNLDNLIANGFTSYRTDYNNILGYPNLYKGKLWEIKSTWEFVSFKDWSIEYHIKRYNEILKRAIQNNSVCVLWFHPSIVSRFINDIMPSIFRGFNEKKDEVYITTASDYVNFLNEHAI